MMKRLAVGLTLCCTAFAQQFTHNIPETVVAGATATITATGWDTAVYETIHYKCELTGDALYASLSDSVAISAMGEAVTEIVIPNMHNMANLIILADVVQVNGEVHTATVTAEPQPSFTAADSTVTDCITTELTRATTSLQLLGMLSCSQLAFIKDTTPSGATAASILEAALTLTPLDTFVATSMDANNIINTVAKLLFTYEPNDLAIVDADTLRAIKTGNLLISAAATTKGYVTGESRLAGLRSLLLVQRAIHAADASFDLADKTIAASLGANIARTWSNIVKMPEGDPPLTDNIDFGLVQTACVKQNVVGTTTNMSHIIQITDTPYTAQIEFTEPPQDRLVATICLVYNGYNSLKPMTVGLPLPTPLVSVIIDTNVALVRPAVVSAVVPISNDGYSISSHIQHWNGATWNKTGCKSIDNTVTATAQCSQLQGEFPLVLLHTLTAENNLLVYTRSKVEKSTAVYVVVIAALVLLLLAFVCCCQWERRSIKKEATAYHERHELIAAGKAPDNIVEVRDLEEEEVPYQPEGVQIEQRKDTYQNENGEWEEVWDDINGFVAEYGEDDGYARWEAAGARNEIQFVNAPLPLETEYPAEQQYFDEGDWAEGGDWQQEGEWQEGEQQWDDQQWQQ